MRKTKENAGVLEEALRDWRRATDPGERLSDSARAKIIDNVARPVGRSAQRPLASLFAPIRRIALTTLVPALLLTLSVGYLIIPGGGGAIVDATSPLLQVDKQGNEIVLTIANGDRSHRIYRSVQPAKIGSGSSIATTNGSYRDSLNSGADLVFYRVD